LYIYIYIYIFIVKCVLFVIEMLNLDVVSVVLCFVQIGNWCRIQGILDGKSVLKTCWHMLFLVIQGCMLLTDMMSKDMIMWWILYLCWKACNRPLLFATYHDNLCRIFQGIMNATLIFFIGVYFLITFWKYRFTPNTSYSELLQTYGISFYNWNTSLIQLYFFNLASFFVDISFQFVICGQLVRQINARMFRYMSLLAYEVNTGSFMIYSFIFDIILGFLFVYMSYAAITERNLIIGAIMIVASMKSVFILFSELYLQFGITSFTGVGMGKFGDFMDRLLFFRCRCLTFFFETKYPVAITHMKYAYSLREALFHFIYRINCLLMTYFAFVCLFVCLCFCEGRRQCSFVGCRKFK